MDGEDTAEFWKGLKRPLSVSPTHRAQRGDAHLLSEAAASVRAVQLSSCCLFSGGERG